MGRSTGKAPRLVPAGSVTAGIVGGLPRLEAIPEPPAGLGRLGREAWVQLLEWGSRWMAPSDLPTVVLVCQAYDDLARAERMARRRDLRPADSIAAMRTVVAVRGQLIRLLGLCGFTPADRARLNLRIVEGAGRLAEFLAG